MNRILALRADNRSVPAWITHAVTTAIAWWQVVRTVADRQRQRAALARLDARLLRDVGITPEQARREAGKAPWRT
ncbi:MAG: DUF1127 domain-containing protein [Chromatiaceae bacterium]|nr:DUF1127 domain-containing protein [Chromatiaceae bacterium]MCP5421760.1 DUF1127 domain-containing protein [Chromatiaceae bacterium]